MQQLPSAFAQSLQRRDSAHHSQSPPIGSAAKLQGRSQQWSRAQRRTTRLVLTNRTLDKVKPEAGTKEIAPLLPTLTMPMLLAGDDTILTDARTSG